MALSKRRLTFGARTISRTVSLSRSLPLLKTRRLAEAPSTDASISDFVSRKDRRRVFLTNYDDLLLLATMENMGESPLVFDSEQRTVAFNLVLLVAKVLLFNTQESNH